MTETIRIATFNVENLDDIADQTPTLAHRIAVMRPQLLRLKADVLCLQEVHGQETPNQPRKLLALEKLLEDTPYADFHKVSTVTAEGDQVYDVRNLVIVSRFEITDHAQWKHEFAPAPRYQKVTANPPEGEDKKITWERPILHAKIALPNGRTLDVVNLHLKSRIPSNVDGQKINNYTWKTASGWAEGFFISSMKRVGQALETRMLVDKLFDEDEGAFLVVCGDFNADNDDVPVLAIRGDVENTGNGELANRVLVPCERTIPEPSRYSLFHHGQGEMLDHLLVSRSLLAYYRGSEVHNELLHDESISFATDQKFPEADHAPVIAEFDMGSA
jgi:endonuclease/exonuclease/phosphatase family metal-dependent hydrolase